MNKKLLSASLALLITSTAVMPIASVKASTTPSVEVSDQKSDETYEETYYISNSDMFNAMENQGINVRNILTPEEYSAALRQDMLRQGSNWIKKYTYKKHKRITIGVNSAIVKVLKYGAQGGVYALQALLAARGMPLDAGASAAIHGTLSSINSSRGHWWHIDLKTYKVVANGNQ